MIPTLSIRKLGWLSLLIAAYVSLPLAWGQQEFYPVHPDSVTKDGVPEGEIQGPFEWHSQIYPGTTREYWIYVPKQYDASKPACTMIVQDGLGRARDWKLPTVMDNLIHAKEMPVTIGVFIQWGLVAAPHDGAEGRYNRSFEYDALGDRYARFLIEEILPEVGKRFHLSSDPNDRLIAGASSGAICAFNAAWERPDAFRRVLSTIGTYVGLRGGHEFPVLIRKTEPKPIRVFLQDGSRDLNIYAGDWWTANLDMLSALTWAGYEVNHAWGEGGHNGRHGAAILPDALRWLWKDHPQPVGNVKGATRRTDILLEGEEWELVSEGHRFTEGPAVGRDGDVYFTDIPNSRIHHMDMNGKVTVFAENTGRANGLMLGPDGLLYACANGDQSIVRYRQDGSKETLLRGVPSNDLVALKHGIYFTDPDNHKVHFVDYSGNHRVVDEGIERPNGLIVSTDHTLLHVADSRGVFGYSFQIQQDGGLQYKQAYFHLHIPYGDTSSGADGMCVDTEGRVYIATRLGIQVCDQLGRVHLIMPLPERKRVSNVVFGGPNRDVLYATCQDKVYRRKLKATGIDPWSDPVKPPRPGL